MDKLKEFLGVVKRQHFWFLSPILLVIGVVGWFLATRKLSAEFEANKSKVQSYISQMGTVSSTKPHPNDEYHAGMEQMISQRRDNVRKAWEKKWERQKMELKWPEDLPADFVSRVEQMRPIETVDVDKRPIPASLRRSYGAFIKEMLPRLAERIDARWAPASGRMGGNFEGFSEPRSRPSESATDIDAEQATHLVDWDTTNQALFEQRFDWGAAPPTTLEVLYAQEDLWVLTTLIDIIKRTNEGALTRSTAPIKAIQFIQIGKDVAPPSKQGFQVVRPEPLQSEEGTGGETTAAGTEAAANPEEPVIYGPDQVTPKGEGGGEPPPAVSLDMELVKNRYYDATYQPIADKETLLSSVTVAKRVPVRMRLQMDQRQIHRLLVECANAPLTFEVRQLRLNPTGGQPMGERRANFGPEPPVSESGGFFSRNRQQARTLPDYQSLDRVVELFGIVYIFNPVNDAVLNGQSGGTPAVPAEEASALLMPADRRLAAR